MSWFLRLFGIHAEPIPQDCLACLLNKSIEFGDRDDAAMALGQFDLPEVEEGLIQVVLDHTEDEMIVDSAGESLLEICLRQEKRPSPEIVARMHPSARRYFVADDA